MKKFTTCLFTILSILSLCYYSAKFYTEKYLCLSDSPIVFWVIIFTVILATLCLGLYNAYSNYKLRTQNIELMKLVKELIDANDGSCAKVLESIYNSRDIALDTHNLVKKMMKEKK